MKTIDIITALKLYTKTEDKQILADMLFTAEQEYRREQTKKSGGNQALKRLKLAEKILKGNQKNNTTREMFHKCIVTEIDYEKMQVFGTPYYQIALREIYKVPAETWKDDEHVEWKSAVSKFFNKGNYEYTPTDFDLTEIKTEFAQWKAEQKRKPPKTRDEFCVVRLGNTGYNAEYFINCVEALGGDVTFLQNGNRTGLSFFESEIGKSLIMPIRLAD